jgi:hypothetical protein
MSAILGFLATIVALGVIFVPLYLALKYTGRYIERRNTSLSERNIRKEQLEIREADKAQAIHNAARARENARNAHRNPPAPPETGSPDPRPE